MVKITSASWFSVPQYTWPLSRCIINLKTLALTEAEKSVTENLIGEKEKWTNKGNDKEEEADSLLRNATNCKRTWYNLDIMWKTAGLVVSPIKVDSYAFLFN